MSNKACDLSILDSEHMSPPILVSLTRFPTNRISASEHDNLAALDDTLDKSAA